MGYKNNEQQNAYTREHYIENKEDYYWNQVMRRKLNPEKYKKIRKEYYERTKEKAKQKKKEWIKNNPEKYKAGNRRRWLRRRDFYNSVRRFKNLLDKSDYI